MAHGSSPHGTNARYQQHLLKEGSPVRCLECIEAHNREMRNYRQIYAERNRISKEYAFYDPKVPGRFYDDNGTSLTYDGRDAKPRSYENEGEREIARQISLQSAWQLYGGWGPHQWIRNRE